MIGVWDLGCRLPIEDLELRARVELRVYGLRFEVFRVLGLKALRKSRKNPLPQCLALK